MEYVADTRDLDDAQQEMAAKDAEIDRLLALVTQCAKEKAELAEKLEAAERRIAVLTR